MDYEKAYKDALERAKMILCNIPEGSASVRDIETIFPELRESEDERIRKAIIELLKEIGRDDTGISENAKCMIAYLERQKWQKPAIKLVFPRFRVGDIIRNVHDECDKTTKRISYVGEHGYNFDYRHLGDKAGGGSFGFCYEDYYELVEPKPAEWGKEDEEKLYQIIETLLADKAAARQENPRHYDVLCEAYDELISWLKRLRPSWKPSEEQIEVDLEEEIKRWWGEEYMKNSEGLPILPIVQGIARHFYEFGLNARKEE